jgi:mannose-6-phosphate isomerase-like protein (cupin superfamily)
MTKLIKSGERLLAIIVPGSFIGSGIHFITPPTLSQQLAYMHHPAGKLITPHIHQAVDRSIRDTIEVLIVRQGKMRVDFFDDNKNQLESSILTAGDVIMLVSGGHGFEVIEEVDLIEVKQGPYVGENDKVRFSPNRSTVSPATT